MPSAEVTRSVHISLASHGTPSHTVARSAMAPPAPTTALGSVLPQSEVIVRPAHSGALAVMSICAPLVPSPSASVVTVSVGAATVIVQPASTTR